MGLQDIGVAKLSKSGKALHIKLDLPNTIFTYHLFINKEGLEKVLAGKQYGTKVTLLVADRRENV
jgi:hypothetical protein